MDIEHLTIENLCGDIKEDQLVEFESKYKLSLLADHRNFILTYNCAFIEPSGIVLKHTSAIHDADEAEEAEEEFGLFFGITEDSAKSLENNYQEYVLDGRVSSNFIPFADSGGGDIFLMSLDGDTKGYIYYWCHEFEDEKPNMLHLANNLNDFLAKFREIIL